MTRRLMAIFRRLSARWSNAALPLAILLAPSRANAETAPQATSGARAALVWIFGDDDVGHAPDATVPPSPAASIGDRPGYDPLGVGYRSRYTGREQRLELRMRGEAAGLVPALATSAEIALGVDASELGARRTSEGPEPLRAEDVGSFVEMRLTPLATGCSAAVTRAGELTVALRLYPLDGDRERVGWLEALAWGGAIGPRRESIYATATGPVRAARLSVNLGHFDAFVALKTATFTEPVANAPAVAETNYGVFGGVEARPVPVVAVGVAGGFFEHGVLEAAESGERATTAGASARLVLQHDMAEPKSPVAFLGRDDDPFRVVEDAPPGAFVVGIEAAGLAQRLHDFDHPGATALSFARGFAAYGGARLGPFETSAAVLVRDPEFVLRNSSGVFPAQTLPSSAERELERSVLLSNRLIVSRLLRVDLALGLRFPAAVMLAALDRLGQPTGATLVVNASDDLELLPPGTVPVPVLDVRPSVEARLSSVVSALGWFGLRRDYNRTRLIAGEGQLSVRGFQPPDRLSYGAAVRAVW